MWRNFCIIIIIISILHEDDEFIVILCTYKIDKMYIRNACIIYTKKTCIEMNSIL